MEQKEFFIRVPEPIEGRVHPWPESKYLRRLSEDYSEKIWKIVLQIPRTRNPYVHEDICAIALKMPANEVAKMIPEIKYWLDDVYFISLPINVAQISLLLARGGQTDRALDLLTTLLELRVKPNELDELSPRFGESTYQDIIEEYIPQFVDVIGELVFDMLCSLLTTTIEFKWDAAKYPNSDPSEWISLDPENYHQDVKYILLQGIRNASEQLLEIDPTRTVNVITNLINRKLSIFHRLAFNILGNNYKLAPNLLVPTLVNRQYFERQSDEYRQLLCRGFSELDLAHQLEFLGWIESVPNDGRIEEDELPSWQLYWLNHIPNALPDAWKQRYEELSNSLGTLPAPHFGSPSSVIWSGPTSPLEPDQIKQMSVKEMVTFLASWQPPQEFMSPSREGTGRSFASVIASAPEQFADNATAFKGLNPIYIRNIISGFRTALSENKTFQWDGILSLCLWVVEQPHVSGGETNEIDNDDPDWGWTLGEIANLLEAGLNSDLIRYKYRDLIWKILKPITLNLDPTVEYETQYINSQHSPTDISINATRGKAIHTIVGYALWLRRFFDGQVAGQQNILTNFDSMPEVQEVLDWHLEHDHSLAIRSIYGQYYPWLLLLDENWTANSQIKIFPQTLTEKAIYKAAWEAYLIHCHAFDKVFVSLKAEYQRAIQNIDLFVAHKFPAFDSNIHLTQHLIVYYWRGLITLIEPESLIQLFYQRANDKLCEEAMRFIGVSLKNTKEIIKVPMKDRLIELWDFRFNNIKGDSIQHLEELAAFKWWFISGKFDINWSLLKLKDVLALIGASNISIDRHVIDQLEYTVNDYPYLSIECLNYVVRSNAGNWLLSSYEKKIRSVIEIAIRSADNEARDIARKLGNYLVSLGYLNFRDLLN